MNKAKIKQVAFIAAVSLGATLLLNTLAKKSAAAAKVQNTVNSGL